MNTFQKNQNKTKPFQTKQINLKQIEIKEPYKPDIIEFNNPEEFTLYWNKNPEEFEEMTTNKLNKKYKIPGYRISLSQIDGNKKLILRKDYSNRSVEGFVEGKTDGFDQETHKEETLELKIKSLEDVNKEILSRLTQIEKYLSSL